MINLTPNVDDSSLSFKDSVIKYRANKMCLEKTSKVAIACIILGIISLVAGLALLASPIGAGLVIGLTVTGAVLIVAAAISLLMMKVSLKIFDAVIFTSANNLRSAIEEKHDQVVRNMVSWDNLSEEFLVSASSKVYVSNQIAEVLISDFLSVYTPKILTSQDSLLMQMLLRVPADYYSVKNACRESSSGEAEALAYEAEFYNPGTVQCTLRMDYNIFCAKIAEIFKNIPEAELLIERFRPDLNPEERESVEVRSVDGPLFSKSD